MARPPYDPEDRKVKLLARLHTEKAVNTLVSMLDSDQPSAAVAAANALLDRGWGKPKQVVEGTFEHEHTVSVGESDSLTPKLDKLLGRRSSATIQ